MKLTNEEIAKIYCLYSNGLQSQIESIIISVTDGVPMELTPISRITDEDAIEVAKIHNWLGRTDKYLNNKGKEILNTEFNSTATFVENAYLFQFLISRHYAVPLWFGINHWANGKTAFELGIAIEKELVA